MGIRLGARESPALVRSDHNFIPMLTRSCHRQLTYSKLSYGVPMRDSIFGANDEPTVEELLADPIASLLMARDDVRPREVLAIVEWVRTALRQSLSGPWSYSKGLGPKAENSQYLILCLLR